MTNWYEIEYDGWKLPGTAEAHYWCGNWKTLGCLNEEEHSKLGFSNKIFVRTFQESCFRAVCKKCYKKWIGRAADKATKRITKFEKKVKKSSKHVVLSIPESQYYLPYTELKRKANLIQKEIGCNGGARIYHPFRFNKNIQEFYFSPHFHIVCIGTLKLDDICKVAKKYGWFIKDVGFRESVFQTFYYLLSHCGIKKRNHTVIWFGDASYSKLPSEKEPEKGVCLACGRKLVPIYYEGVHPVVPPDQVFEGFVDSEGWYKVETIPESEWTKSEKYEYALERELYVANSGISFSN